ncbi:hypothetical protein OJF2_78320 (plasmid) [Aquisphaera giovannonii]|uniref:O-Antigen ligase n=1 Tax=Aquisphaera giovannonii TaxID=406548 RepID=A0A5B9WEZ8_9BACT|nr:hypothetical protein [Aquisphaera giovannonii]QEH39218.1 hypothetical protein OJF2_78320 [Aquisphaera giovannonii]
MQILIVFAALLGCIPATLLLFASLPARLAVVVAVVAGWILLPPVTIDIPGLPNYGKQTAVVLGCLIGTFLFQPNRLLAFRPRWFDLPMAAWCLCPMASSLANGLGVYDGLAASYTASLAWGFPYLIGRLYLGDPSGIRLLTTAVALGGIALILPCLFEIRMSAMLLPKVYGLGVFEGRRMGGWRPRVFFTTGLELGMWMTASSLSCAWLWRSGILKRIGPFPAVVPLVTLLITSLLCRTGGASTLLIAGLAALWLSVQLRTRVFLCAVLSIAPAYFATRIPNIWTGKNLVAFIDKNLDPERAQSLDFRFDNENILVKKALRQPIWGWGGWARGRVTDEHGRDISVTDGMWIIYLGDHGSVGLACWTTALLLPSWIFVKRFPARRWSQPDVAPMAACAMLLGLYSIDCLVNGFMNLAYIVALGGLASAATSPAAAYAADRGRAGGPRPHAAESAPGRSPLVADAAAAPGLPAPDPRQVLADRYRGLARSLGGREGDRAAAADALGHAYTILSAIASARPDDAEAQRRRRSCGDELARLLVAEAPSPGDAARALELTRQATREEPGRARYWTTLGAACCRAGDPAAAIAALERSIALRGGVGGPLDHAFLALAHAQLGDLAAARVHRERAGIGAAGQDNIDRIVSLVDDQINAHSV